MRGVLAGRGSVVGPEEGRRPVVRARGAGSVRRGRALAVLVLAAVLCSSTPVAAAQDPGDADPAADAAGADAPDPDREAADDAAAAAEAARVAAVEAAARDLRDAEQERARAHAGLQAARATVGATRSAGAVADGRVRVAEEALPPLVLARRDLRTEIRSTDAELRRLRAAERRTRSELVRARDALAQQAILTFKTGRSAELLGPVAVLREARDPGQLVRGLADLRAVTRDGARSVGELEGDLRAMAAAASELEQRRTRLTAELAEAAGAVAVGEDAAAAARAGANAAEARFVSAMEAELAAKLALERAEQRHASRRAAAADVAAAAAPAIADRPAPAVADRPAPAVADRPPPDVGRRGGSASDEPTVAPDVVGVRAADVSGRRRALERAARLTADQRRTAEAWQCPVADARFVNDWAFPRSGLRRHEGTDVFGDRGTPILAVTGGVATVLDATDGRGDLGGITVTVADGDSRQYYAHLEAIEPGLRRGDEVRPGDRLGWVGTSGNARGTPPHLHLGWYVDDVAVNPYASLAVACDGRSRPARDDDVVPADADEGAFRGADGEDGEDGEEDEGGSEGDVAVAPSPVTADQGWRWPSPASTAR